MGASREIDSGLTPLQALSDAIHAYLDLRVTQAQLQEQWDRTEDLFLELLEQQSPHLEESLREQIENVLDLLEVRPNDQQLAEVSQALLAADSRLQAYDLSLLHELVHQLADEQQLLEEVSGPISELELEAGYLSEIVEGLDQVLHAQLDPEPFFRRIEELLEQTQQGHLSYLSTPLAATEWTAEVALADRLMEEGFRLWLEALTSLREQLSGEFNEETILQALELLREGNRNWIKVERLAGVNA